MNYFRITSSAVAHSQSGVDDIVLRSHVWWLFILQLQWEILGTESEMVTRAPQGQLSGQLAVHWVYWVHLYTLLHCGTASLQISSFMKLWWFHWWISLFFFRFRVSRSGFAILCGCFPHMWYEMWRDEILERFCTCVSNITTITAEFNIVYKTTAGNLSF